MPDRERVFFRYLERPTRRRLEKVVRAYHETVWATAFRVTRCREDAEDISQEVFLKFLLDPPRPGSVHSPAAYFAWQVIGKAMNWRRAADRRQAREARGIRTAATDGLSVDDREALHEAIASLPDDLRGAIQLRYLGGLKNMEIAGALGVSERTVEDRLHRGREALRRKLTQASVALGVLFSALEGGAGPPPGLLPRLLRVARLGSALSLTGVASRVAVVTVAKKYCAVAVVVLAGLLVPLSLHYWNEAGPERRVASSPVISAVSSSVSKAEKDTKNEAGDAKAPARPAREGLPALTASLQGEVRDEDEKLVPGAVIRLRPRVKAGEGTDEEVFGDAFELETVSSESGEYVFPEVPAGPLYVTARAGTLLLQRHRYPLRLEVGEKREFNLLLCHPRRIVGALRDSSGAAVANATVWLEDSVASYAPRPVLPKGFSTRPYSWLKPFPVDGRGRFDTGLTLMVNDRVAGSDPVEVRAVAKGFALVIQRVRPHQFLDYEARLDFTLEPDMPVSLLVVDPAGHAVEDAEVGFGSAESRSGEADTYGTVKTDAQGKAVLEHLPRERRRLRVEKEGYKVASVFVEPGASTDLRVTLSPLGPGVEGRVTFDDAFPEDERGISDIYFESRDALGKLTRLYRPHGKLDPKTREFVYWPEPGRYSLRVHLGLLSWATETFEYTGSAPVRADIHVTVEPPYLSGTVVRADTGKLVAGVSVLARFVGKGEEYRSSWGRSTRVNGFDFTGRPGNARGTKTDGEGRFLLLLPRDNGRQQFWSPESSVAALTAGSDAHGWAEDLAIEFDRTTVRSDLRLELFPNGSVEGHVTSGAGEPSADELVVASDFEGWTHWGRSGRDGRYRIDHLRPGHYLVLPLGHCASPVIGGGTAGGDAIEGLPPPHEFFERPVRVTGGEVTRLDIDLRKDSLGRIEGTVAEGIASTSRVSYAMLVGGIPRRAFAIAGDVEVLSGRFVRENLLAGAYRLRVHSSDALHGDLITAETDIMVRRGATAEAHLEPPQAALRVPLRASAGPAPTEVQVIEAHRIDRTGQAEPWGGWKVEREGDVLQLEALPPGLVKVHIVAPGFIASWSEPLHLVEVAQPQAPAVTFEPGRDIIVRLEAPPGFPSPVAPRFGVIASEDGLPVAHTARKLGAERDAWALSAFAPGTYRLSARAGNDFQTAGTTVTITEERDAEVDLQLEVHK